MRKNYTRFTKDAPQELESEMKGSRLIFDKETI